MRDVIQRTIVRVAAAFAALGVATGVCAGPARVANKQPYRVTATATATGRTGSATMSARALIDRDQHALLEVVAGDFETVPAGTLTKIQLKMYDGNGNLLSASNYTGLDRFALALPLAAIDRGQALDVQGNIRNVDGNRTDVVSVTTVGRLRPDVAVSNVQAPTLARAAVPVPISAAVTELNHDTGARATCQLLVDGEAVDRAEGIWVDAGDTVSCAFVHVFTAGGAHQIRVDAVNVNPGDWDTANNSATGSVTIISDEESFPSGSAWLSMYSTHYRSHITAFSRPASSLDYVRSLEYLTDQSNDTQGALYVAYVNSRVSFPLTQVAVAQWTDDTLVHQGVYTTFAATSVSNGLTCGRVVDDADRTTYVEVCSSDGLSGAAALTTLTYARYAGTVTYFSSQSDALWYETPAGIVPVYTYSSNYRESRSEGTLVPLGSTYRFEVTLINGGVSYSKPITLALSPVQPYTDINHPWHCLEFSDPYYGYKKTCQEFIDFRAAAFWRTDWQ